MKDIQESKRLRKLVHSKHKQCYLNAARAVVDVPDFAQADYIEGYAVIDGLLCIEHGWIERDSVVIDPSIPEDEMAYFPGLRLSGRKKLRQALAGRKSLPIFYDFGWGGVQSPDFLAAAIAAYRFAGHEQVAQRYEMWLPVVV